MIFVCGASRSGKTHTLALASHLEPQLRVVSASQVLKKLGLPLSELSTSEAIENQQELCAELRRQHVVDDPSAALDGHLAIETRQGPLTLPDSIVDALQPAGFAVISATVALICERRSQINAPWSEDQARSYSITEAREARRHGARLDVPVAVIRSGDGIGLVRFWEAIRKSFPAGVAR